MLGIVLLSACGNTQPEASNNVAAASSVSVPDAAPVATSGAGADVTANMAATTSATALAAGSGTVAQCPGTIGAPGSVPSGARRLGNATATDLKLSDAVIAMTAPADYDPAQGNLDEAEADDIEGDPYVTAATFSYQADQPTVSLVCRYGKSVLPLSGEAMLLIPLKPQAAQCRFTAAKGSAPAAMSCQATKPA